MVTEINSVFIFLTRPGCHLCDEARPLVDAVLREGGAPWQEVDIDGDDRLVKEYGMRIPVLLSPRGEVVAEGLIDRRSLRRGVRRHRARG